MVSGLVSTSTDFAQRAGDYTGTYFLNNRHGQSTVEKFLFLTDAVAISPTDDGRLSVATGGTGRSFTETAPDLFVRADGQDSLVFHRGEIGQVTGASLNSRAVFTLERRSWYESPSIAFPVLSGKGIVLLAGLVINGLLLWRGRNSRPSAVVALGRWSAVVMPLLNLAFIAGFVLLLPTMFLSFPGTTVRLVLLLPVVAAALTLVLAGVTLTDWLHGAGTRFIRLQYTVLVLAGTLFAVVLHTWNLLGWQI